MLKNAFRTQEKLFQELFDHCRRNNFKYADTRELILREMILKMNDMAKEHNMIEHVKENYLGRSKSDEKMYSVEERLVINRGKFSLDVPVHSTTLI